MFTGIVEEIGMIQNIRSGSHSAVLTIKASKVLEYTAIGDSIAVNGRCLTVTSAVSYTHLRLCLSSNHLAHPNMKLYHWD